MIQSKSPKCVHFSTTSPRILHFLLLIFPVLMLLSLPLLFHIIIIILVVIVMPFKSNWSFWNEWIRWDEWIESYWIPLPYVHHVPYINAVNSHFPIYIKARWEKQIMNDKRKKKCEKINLQKKEIFLCIHKRRQAWITRLQLRALFSYRILFWNVQM